MTNSMRQDYGEKAMEAGSPDYWYNDVRTNATDTIANILHRAYRNGETFDDLRGMVQSALIHVENELAEEEE